MSETVSGTHLLVVMRHAKAESYADDDHERALTARGRADAAAAGDWLAEVGVAPDAALVSTALRTRQTWAEVSRAAGLEVEASFEEALYSAGPEGALEVLRGLPDDAATAMYLGHNPTSGYLVQLLNDGAGDEAALSVVSTGWPTAAVAVLEVPQRWADLAVGSGTLRHAHVPRS